MKLRNKKTGEIGYLELEKADDKNNIALRVYKNDFIYKRYESLTEVIAEWEDYAPKEPLIKDEKICKAVRVWAECNSLDNDDSLFISKPTFDCKILTLERGFLTIDFYYNDESLCNKTYTIAELCGEEEDA